MPPLSSFITYRPGKKAKAAIKAPFSLLRGDSSNTTSSTTSHQQPTPTDVIDINNSLDFDIGKPSTSFEHEVFDDPRSSQHNLTGGTSPQVELDIELSSDSNGFSDWLEAFDAKQDAIPSRRLTRLKNPLSLNIKLEEGQGEAGEEFASEDIITDLQPIEASHTTPLEHDDVLQGSYSLKRLASSLITVPDSSSPKNYKTAPDLFIGTNTTRPLSSHSEDNTAFSALSGTTIARALISNSFILSADRSSLYRNGTSAGLTRSDSATLPLWEGNSSPMFYNDRFSVESAVPPIPSNAELYYEPPRKSRKPRNEEKPTKRHFRRQSSTGSLSPKRTPEMPPSTNNNNDIITLDVDFNSEGSQTSPRIPRSPLPRTPTPRITIDEDTTPDRASTPNSFQEITQQLPVDAQLLSPDSNTPSPAHSEGHTSPKEMEGLLNFYSLPDSPELVPGAVFRLPFSPISEESSLQLSPPVPFHIDRRDSQRIQPVGARSPLSGSLRARGDSTVLPRQDQHVGPLPQIVLQDGEGVQSNITPASPTTLSDSSFYFTGDDSSDVTLTPPELSKIFNSQRSGNVPSPINVFRNSRDINAYNITLKSPSRDTTSSAGGFTISQEFPETPEAFSPMFSAGPNTPGMIIHPADTHESSPIPPTPVSAAILGGSNSNSVPAAQLLLKRTSVRRSRQGSLSKMRTNATTRSGSPSIRIADITESPETTSPILSLTAAADDAITDTEPSHSELSANQNDVSLSTDVSRPPSGSSIGQDAPDTSISMNINSTGSRLKSLPAIPMISPMAPLSPEDESPPISLPATSTTSIVLADPTDTPSTTPPQTVKLSVPRGRLPPALTISKHTNASGSGAPVAINGTDQSGQSSPELDFQQPPHDPPGIVTPALSDHLSPHHNEAFHARASDIFRGISLGSPPPYYSVVHEALMQDNRSPDLPRFSSSSSRRQGSDSIAGPSSRESTLSNDIGRNVVRESSFGSQRARIRPPLPAGPRRPSQQLASSPGPRRTSFSSIASSTVLSDSQARPPTRYINPAPSPSFQVPAPKWKGYTMEVAKWTFTSAQLQAIVSRAIRQSAEASSIRLLRLEVLDHEIPVEIQMLSSQMADVQTRYKASTRKRATILDSLYSSLSRLEDGNSAHRLLRQLDELKELTQSLDRLAEEIHSVDQQLSHLESLTHIHTGSALAMALRKLNSSFLKQVAENQVLRSQIQSLEAERDEAWQQAQNVADEYDQINDNIYNSSKRSSRVSAKRKSSARVSIAGLRTPNRVSMAGLRTPNRRLSQRSLAGRGTSLSRVDNKSPPPPLPKRRPTEISTDSPATARSSTAFSTSGITPTTESRALAQAQDELYAMLGITNPERPLHRSRSESSRGSPATPSSRFLSPRSAESSWMRRSSLPGALSLTEAYSVMEADRNAVLTTIDMLSAME